MMTNQLLRERVIERPRSIQDLLPIFRVVWKNAFFDGLYIDEPVSFEGNTAVWIGSKCHAYESIKKARMLDGYECGCQAVRSPSALSKNLIVSLCDIPSIYIYLIAGGGGDVAERQTG